MTLTENWSLAEFRGDSVVLERRVSTVLHKELFVDIRPSVKWEKATRAQILSFDPDGAVCKVGVISGRGQSARITWLEENHLIPYSKIVGEPF